MVQKNLELCLAVASFCRRFAHAMGYATTSHKGVANRTNLDYLPQIYIKSFLKSKSSFSRVKFWTPVSTHNSFTCVLTTLSFACISLSFRLARTCMWELTCLRVRVFPVRSLMYRAISSFLPAKSKQARV